jgi:DNA ligase-4
MLCQRIDFKTVRELLNQKEFYVETKMDGERFSVHKDEDKWKYFSRNCIDYTDSFNATLTPYLEKLFEEPVKSIILDGEMMVWDKIDQQYRDKSENLDAKNLKGENPCLRQCFCVYDILYLNGETVIQKPYAERIRLLNKLVKEHQGIFTKCKREKIRDMDHLVECLNKAIEDKEEGIVIKDIGSMYKPNERNGGWYKIKPDVSMKSFYNIC